MHSSRQAATTADPPSNPALLGLSPPAAELVARDAVLIAVKAQDSTLLEVKRRLLARAHLLARPFGAADELGGRTVVRCGGRQKSDVKFGFPGLWRLALQCRGWTANRDAPSIGFGY